MARNKRKILEAARKHAQKGARDKALREYEKLVKLDPRDAKLRLEIGDAYRRWGQLQEAIAAYTKVAEQYMDEGFDARAVAVFKQIQNLDPGCWVSYVPLAELYQRMGLTSEAVQSLQTAADGLNKTGKKHEALDLLRKMASLDPSNTTSRIKVADLLHQENLNREAIAEYESAHTELERQGSLESAATVLERILAIEPERPSALALMGRNCLRRDLAPSAETFAKRALEAEPEEPGHFELLADVYRAQERDGELAETYRGLADLYHRRGDEDRAREIIQRFVPPDHIGAARDLELTAPSVAETGVGASPSLFDAALLGVEELPEEVELSEPVSPPCEAEVTFSDAPASSAGDAESELDTPLAARALDQELDEMVTGEGDTAADTEQELAEASVYLRYGKRAEALRNLSAILSRDPNHREALEKLGDYHADGEDPDAAVGAWLRAGELAREAGDDEALSALHGRVAALDAVAAGVLAAESPFDQESSGVEIFDAMEQGFYKEKSGARPESEERAVGGTDLEPEGVVANGARNVEGVLEREVELELGDSADVELEDSADVEEALEDEVELELEDPAEVEAGLEDGVDLELEDPADVEEGLEDEVELELEIAVGLSGEAEDEALAGADEALAGADEALAGADEALAVQETQESPGVNSEAGLSGKRAEPSAATEELTGTSLVEAAAESSITLGSNASASASTAKRINEDLEEAEFYRTQGLKEEAAAVYRRVLEAAPNHPLALVRMGEVAAESGVSFESPAATVVRPEPEGVAPPLLGGSECALFDGEPKPFDGSVDSASAQGPIDPGDSISPAAALDPGDSISPAAALDPGDSISPAAALVDAVAAPPETGVSEGLEETGDDFVGPAQGTEIASVEPSAAALVSGGALGEMDVDEFAIDAAAEFARENADKDYAEAADSFDLAAELRGVLDDEHANSHSSSLSGGIGSEEDQDAFSAVFAEFKKGVSKTLDAADHEAHYDLGIAYREMGLLEDAIDEFNTASQCPERRVACLHMLGLCSLDLGRGAEAVEQLEGALGSGQIEEEQRLALTFDLGCALEAAGWVDEARKAWQEVAAVEPTFRNVEARLTALDVEKPDDNDQGMESFDDLIAEVNAVSDSAMAEDSQNEATGGEPGSNDSSDDRLPAAGARKRRKKKISFV